MSLISKTFITKPLPSIAFSWDSLAKSYDQKQGCFFNQNPADEDLDMNEVPLRFSHSAIPCLSRCDICDFLQI